MPDNPCTSVDQETKENLSIAIAELIDSAGGIKRVAHMLSRSDKLLYKWMDPRDDAWPPILTVAFLEAHVVKDRGREPALAKHFLAPLGYVVQKIECTKGEAPVTACIHALSSCGAFTAQVADTLEDGKVTPREAKDLKKSIDSQLTALEALRRSLADVAGGA